MLYVMPDLVPFQAALDELDELRRRLGAEVARPAPWVGRLRRDARASAARSSTAVEGYQVTHADAVALLEGELAASGRDQRAFAGYALAMQHVGVLADDPSFGWSDRLILDLHFEVCSSEPSSRPGRWRLDDVHVTAPGGGIAYRAPHAREVVGLIEALSDWLTQSESDPHVVARAAMAHLHLVSIHPFRDGNGRLSRILQSLVLARDGVLAPELGSIEEALARSPSDYYAVLQQVQGGRYQPERPADAWLTFCLDAHLALARERLGVIEAAAGRWAVLERIVEAHGWPDRLAIALEQALFEGATRAGYCAEADVSPATGSADLRRLHDAGWVVQVGKGRNTKHVASSALRDRVGRPRPPGPGPVAGDPDSQAG